MAVKTIVLDTEDNIVEDSNKGQDEFDQVQSILHRQSSTGKGEDSPYEIKDNVEDRPPLRTLPLIVPIGRRSVLYQRYHQLRVSQYCDRIPIFIPLHSFRLNTPTTTS